MEEEIKQIRREAENSYYKYLEQLDNSIVEKLNKENNLSYNEIVSIGAARRRIKEIREQIKNSLISINTQIKEEV